MKYWIGTVLSMNRTLDYIKGICAGIVPYSDSLSLLVAQYTGPIIDAISAVF